VSHTCEATFGAPGRGRKGRGGAREPRKRGVATDARGLPALRAYCFGQDHACQQSHAVRVREGLDAAPALATSTAQAPEASGGERDGRQAHDVLQQRGCPLPGARTRATTFPTAAGPSWTLLAPGHGWAGRSSEVWRAWLPHLSGRVAIGQWDRQVSAGRRFQSAGAGDAEIGGPSTLSRPSASRASSAGSGGPCTDATYALWVAKNSSMPPGTVTPNMRTGDGPALAKVCGVPRAARRTTRPRVGEVPRRSAPAVALRRRCLT
jgi:hypothetical protein